MHKSLGYLTALGTVFFVNSAHAECASSCEHGLSTTVLKKIAETGKGTTVEWKGQQWTVDYPGAHLHQLQPPILNRLFRGENDNDRLVCHYDVFSKTHAIGRVVISIQFCEALKK